MDYGDSRTDRQTNRQTDRQTDNLEAGEAAVILDVHAVRRYLDGHATDDALTIARVAAVFGFSREHLSRQFASVFAVSPHAYLSQLRLRRIFAARSEGLKVEPAVLLAGFRSRSSYYRPRRRRQPSPRLIPE